MRNPSGRFLRRSPRGGGQPAAQASALVFVNALQRNDRDNHKDQSKKEQGDPGDPDIQGVTGIQVVLIVFGGPHQEIMHSVILFHILNNLQERLFAHVLNIAEFKKRVPESDHGL